MKKKLIQVLMLLVATVSIGVFVSCKDTNEDLYNQLKTEIDDASGGDLAGKIKYLEGQITALQNCCAIGTGALGGLADDVANLQAIVDALTGGSGSGSGTGSISIGGDVINIGGGSGSEQGGGKTLDEILGDEIIDLINQQGDLATLINLILNEIYPDGDKSKVSNIVNLLADMQAAQGQLDDANAKIKKLEEDLAKIKSCECEGKFAEIFERLSKLEADMTQVKADVQTALNKADEALKGVEEVRALANAAQAAADKAQADATAAQQTADKAVADAKANAEKIAEVSQALADKAKELADALNGLAEKVENNKKAIEDNKKAIDEIKITITTLSENVTKALQDAADAAAQAKVNKAAIDSLCKITKDNEDDIAGLKTTVNTLNTNVTNLTEIVNNLSTQVDNNTTNITNLTTNLNDLKTDVTNLTTRMTEVEKGLKEQGEKLTELEARLAAIEGQTAISLEQVRTIAKEEAEAVKTALEAEIETLKAQLVNFITKDQVYTKEEVDDLLNKLEEKLKVTIDSNTARIVILEGQIQLYDGKIVDLTNIVNEQGERITALETKLAGYETLVETVNGHTTTIEKLTTDLSNLTDKVGENTSAIEAINAALEAIKQCTCDPEAIAAINESISNILERLEKAEGDIANNTELINKAKEELTNAINEAIDKLKEELVDKINNVDDKVDAANDKIEALQLAFDNLKYVTPEELDEVVDILVGQIEAEKLARETGDEELQKQIDEIQQSVVDAVARIAANEVAIAALDAAKLDAADFNDFKEEYEAYKQQNEADKASMLDRIETNEIAISDLQDAVETINDRLDALEDDVEDLKERMAVAETNLNTAMSDIMELRDDVSAIQDQLAKQVTSIEIQGTKNPWFGTFSLPFGTQSNFLVAFYGKPKNDIEFPTSSTGNYVRPEEALTDKDMEMIDGVEIFEQFANIPLMYDNYSAGKIYMTINPNTADVSGLQPVIVNSLDEESLITLSPIKPSSEKLQFGFTRADNNNGFYEAEASVAPNMVKHVNAPKFETGALKDAIENAKGALEELARSSSTGGANSKLAKVASDIRTIINGLKFDRNALKCSYTAKDANGEDKVHSVYSHYNLAATAFRPLNLETAKDFNYQTIPGYERVNNLLDRVANRVNTEIHTFFYNFNSNGITEKLANLEIKKIVVKDLSEDLLAKFDIEISEDFVIEGLSYHLQMPIDVNVPVKFEKDLHIPVHLEGVEVSIPVKWSDEISVDLSNVYIETPTVVVKGSATGHPDDVEDKYGNPITVLVIPVLDGEGKVTGYTEIPLDNFKVDVDIEASNASTAGGKIYLNGKAYADIVIDETYKSTVDIDKVVDYHLVIEDTFSTTVNIDQWFYFGDNGTDKKTFHFEKSISMRGAVEELWGNAQEAIGSVNTMLDQLRDLVDAVNDALEKINSYEEKLTSTVDSYVDRLKSYLDKINSKVVGLINSTNSRFQPFMVASTPDGMKRLSGSRNYPTTLGTEVTLHPTSQTLELFVPFARKHIAVTNVFKGDASAQDGDSKCLEKLKAANTGKINTVLNGSVREVKMSNLSKYYVYEVSYSVLDFEGKIATRKYYINVR